MIWCNHLGLPLTKNRASQKAWKPRGLGRTVCERKQRGGLRKLWKTRRVGEKTMPALTWDRSCCGHRWSWVVSVLCACLLPLLCLSGNTIRTHRGVPLLLVVLLATHHNPTVSLVQSEEHLPHSKQKKLCSTTPSFNLFSLWQNC